eukprot:TRINITY_DN4067_c0_g1_i4.p1 TRINITY_DN4067_c0_g1~~TRINITY_DN4067_c0_g1_i4.p1  ORF type:complete len:1667 (-),score=523.48 TRINITY_DN4067_c0_g1_i4:172-5172(-)
MANIHNFSGARPKQQTNMQRFAQEKYNFEHADHNFALDPASAANRRKKKRPTVGVKTIEVNRGRFGFGFTLSGQSPCILSSVIAGSPAERVGLHSGDCLIAVNGRNVSKLPHNEVVKLISICPGSLIVQIAENYCTDSSSEDEGGRARPKYPHRRFPNRKDRPLAEINSNQARFENGRDLWLLNNQIKPRELEYYQSDSESCREKLPTPRKHVRSNSADSSFVDLNTSAPLMSTPKKKNSEPAHKKVDLNAMDELNIGGELNSFFNQNLSELRKSIKLHNQRKLNIDISSAESKCVVGYLGTIEMPKGVNQGASSGLQEIRNCIRRLRVEKKVHTLVLFCIFPSQVVLINHHGLKLAEFAAENIKFCGVYADDRRFFGLVTSQMRGGEESDSSSCHVFMVEPINNQAERQQRATTFQFELTFNNNGDCVEFPANADPILAVIYQLRGLSPSQGDPEPNQLQDVASTSSSSGSSNSDSGIGFRDEALQPQGAERALVVDVQNERIRLQNLTRLQEQQQQENIRGLPPRYPHNASISSSDSERDRTAAISKNMSPPPSATSTSKLTVRAMPDPALGLSNPGSADSSFNTDRLESLQSAEHIRLSMQKYLQDKHEHLKKTSQLLVDKNTVNGPTASTPNNIGLENSKNKLFDKFTNSREAKPRPLPSVSDRSFVRSLEDLRSVDNGSVYSHPDLDLGPPSLPVNPNLPLARFLYSSDSNLSQLEVPPLAPLDLANHPLNKWQEAQGSYSSTVLRPCDQYPEQGLVRRRDRSAHSTSSTRSYRASVHVESSDYDNISWREMGRLSQRSNMSKSQSLKRKEKITGDEFERMSFNGDVESICSRRESTLGRVRERRKSDSASIIQDQNDTISNTGSQGTGSPKKDIGRVGGWAADFEKLLNDAAGLQTFAEFLKKEFSHENIYFWCACEKYKSIEAGIDRLRFARDVMERHLAQGASDPVNVDSMARSSTQERLSFATAENPPDLDLFITAQTQIYNLMKFDSFSRFLKSDLYKDSLLADMAGNSLPFDGQDLDFDLMTTAVFDLDKSDSSMKNKSGEVRRKSILPWNNIRNRSKSKDRGDQNTSDSKPAMFIKKLTGQNSSDKSRQSLSNSELKADVKDLSDPLNHSSESCDKESCTLTRFILPDRATTVVSTPQGETIRSLVSRLLDKRGLKFTSFDAFVTGNEKPLDLSEDCSTLGCSEVRVEPRVLFRLELPSKKSIGVKAKQTKLVEEVLGPILSQYGWSLQDMTVRLDQGPRRQESVDMRSSVTSIDNSRLVVHHMSEDLSTRTNESENDSNRSDSRPNSRSSLNLGPRRQSNSSIDSRKHEDLMPPPKIIPTNKRRPLISAPSPTSAYKDQEASLYEGLKRMTKGRLDDQRGLEINSELPDFLKKGSRASEPIKSETSRVDLTSRLSGPAELGNLPGWDRDHARHYIDYIDSTFTTEGLIPSMAEADEIFTPVNPDESLNFNESRLSLGLGRLSMGSAGYQGIEGMRVVSRPSIGAVRDYEGVVMGGPRDYDSLHKGGMRDHVGVPGIREHRAPPARDYDTVLRSNNDYEGVNFNTRKDYEHLAFRPSQAPQVAPKPRLTSVDEDAVPSFQEPMPKRPPPPLPPKPVRGPPPLPPHAQHLHNNFGKLPHPAHSHELHELPVGVTRTKSGVYLGMPGEKGYNVSFV